IDHSHMLMTTLRSTPWGRGGFSAGSSPAAMRSVQSANSANAFGPNWPRVRAMLALAWPACTRWVHAWTELVDEPHSFSSVRMPLEPSAWHDWQEFFTVSIQ